MQGDLHYPTPYTNRNSHIAQNNGGSLINYARGGSAPKELLHNPNNSEVSSHYNNQMPENVQVLNNSFQAMNIS